MITYITAWLKVHYPTYFIAAALTNAINSNAKDSEDKVKAIIREAKNLGINIMPPDINISGHGFIAQDNKTIRFGLNAIKGIGHKAVDAILDARGIDTKFKDLYDFLDKANLRVCNKRVVSCLIISGAFDNINKNRLGLLNDYFTHREDNIPDEVKISKDVIVPVYNEYTLECKLEWEKLLARML